MRVRCFDESLSAKFSEGDWDVGHSEDTVPVASWGPQGLQVPTGVLP